jgi:lipopolysaccharide assembly protein A
MSSFYLIMGLIFSLLIAIIALANNEAVTVSYIFGRVEVSLILLIFGAAFSGALVMGLFSLFRSIRSALAFRESRRKQEALQKRIKQLEDEKIFLEAELNKYVSVQEEMEADLVEPEENAYNVEISPETEVDEEPR